MTIVDVVTTHGFNLYSELLAFLGQTDAALTAQPTNIYAATCRGTRPRKRWLLENWYQPLAIGTPLPTLPLWLTNDFAMSLNLEGSYEETVASCELAEAEGQRGNASEGKWGHRGFRTNGAKSTMSPFPSAYFAKASKPK